MDVYKIAVKVFARGGEIPSDQVIALFQRWIRDQSVPGHRLIDVADYAHVVAGPGPYWWRRRRIFISTMGKGDWEFFIFASRRSRGASGIGCTIAWGGAEGRGEVSRGGGDKREDRV